MDTHVKVLGVLYIICGVLGIVVALGALLIAGIALKAVEQEAGPEAPQARFAIAGVFGFLVILVLILSVPNIIAGAYLFKYRNWARILCIVLSMLNLMSFPLGTALGVYGLVVLFNEKTVALFKRA